MSGGTENRGDGKTRFSLLVGSATAATIAQALEPWPVSVRALLASVVVGLWLATVVRRV